MKKSVFDRMADELRMEIINEVAYTYSAFVPKDVQNIRTKLKSNITVPERKLLEQDFQSEAGSRLLFPDVMLREKVKKYISDFYDELALSDETLKKLSECGNRAEIFKEQFRKDLEKSKETTLKSVLRETDLQIMQNKDVNYAMKHIQTAVGKRMSSLKELLRSKAGQLRQYMLLWEYQDNGYKYYRLKTNGDNCKACTELENKVFPIKEAEVGENLAPLHPNCDCSTEIVDEKGNTVYLIKNGDVEESSEEFEYLKTSLKQVVLGNFSEDINLLGTLGQIALGLLGLDLPADIRDLLYDITNWKMTPEHALQTILDAAALLPVVGGLKYTDEAGDLLKNAVKRGDEVGSRTKFVRKKKRTWLEKPGSLTSDIIASKIDVRKIYSELKTEPDTAFFWSGKTEGIGGSDIAEKIAKKNGGVTLELIMADRNIVMPEWDFNNPESIDVWEWASAAFAEQATGEVRAVIGKDLRAGNIWENVELPELMNNRNITKITIIDPKTEKEVIVFRR